MRFSYVWRSEFLRNVRAGRKLIEDLQNEGKIGLTADALDVYEGSFERLDILVQYTWKGITIFFEGTNLTGEPLEKYYGDRIRVAYVQHTSPIYFVGYKWTM